MNPFYEKFIQKDVDETILKNSQYKMSFEDHFWLLACMALYYEQNNQDFLEQKCLSKACDLNYLYHAYLYFDSQKVLPKSYQPYLALFEHPMKNDQLEEMIQKCNKKARKTNGLGFAWYSLFTILMIPLTFLFALVFHWDATLSAFLSLGIVTLGQLFFTNYRKNQKQRKDFLQQEQMPKEVKQIFSSIQKYEQIFQDPNYIALLRAKPEETEQIVQCIKEHRIYQPPQKEKKNKKQKPVVK